MKYRSKNCTGKFDCVKEGLIAKRILEYENIKIEAIRIETTISIRKWCVTFAYRPPENNSKASFFMDLN